MVRQQAVQAKQDGRHDEARELWEKAEQIERDMQGGLEKIERFKIDSQIKDRQMMIGRAKKQGDVQKAAGTSQRGPADSRSGQESRQRGRHRTTI